MNLVRPSIIKLDEQVKNTRKSQIFLANNIDKLSIRKNFFKFFIKR